MAEGLPNPDPLYERVAPGTRQSLARFREQHPPRELRVGRHTWKYVVLGEGSEAVLFLHGMAGAHDIWWQQLEALKSSFRLLAVTYPPIPNLEGLRLGLRAVLDAAGIGSFNVVGTSLGGYLAQYLVATQPQDVRRAVFANTFPPNDLIARRTRRVRPLLPLLPERVVLQVLRRSTERVIYPACGHSELVRAYLLEQASLMTKAQFLARYRCVIEPFQAPDLRALDVPALILESDNDPLVEPELRQALKTTYPSARVHTFRSAGHFPYLNLPRDYSRQLQVFLQGDLD